MKILFATSEAVPFVKSGGLADVAGSLTRAVRNRMHACRVVMPLYGDIPESFRQDMKFLTFFNVPLGWRNQYCGVFEYTHFGVKHYFLDNEYYFKRRGIYGFFDDAERFAFFSKAVLELLHYIDFKPEIIHCNDWQTALVPVYLNVFYRHLDAFRNIKTVFTIHNIQYQGMYDKAVRFDVAGLPAHAGSILEFNKDTNYMKGAIEQCGALTTVSPSYAKELMDPWYAHGLDGVIRDNQYKLSGILNGIDFMDYDPSTDMHLAEHFSAENREGRAKNKEEIQTALGLEPRSEAMVIGMVTRLVSHKGLDLVRQVFDRIMELDAQFVLLGTGDWQYEKFFREKELQYPGRVCSYIGFNDGMARRIYGSCDAFLMPSKSEPCGLSQMIALRYGSIPIVRATGGLRDTINDFGGDFGNGFNFQSYDAYDMLDAIYRANSDFQDKEKWDSHVKTAMNCDFSWGRSAGEYINLYKSLLSEG
ncbi:glycogen synthase GlgA, partial [Ruminococcaceae bacterium OttesenSCG-928-L11]|nr:glycogen synthase GlgA [Ruminococcaceae bacterium OttesenSCG-928-L11]